MLEPEEVTPATHVDNAPDRRFLGSRAVERSSSRLTAFKTRSWSDLSRAPKSAWAALVRLREKSPDAVSRPRCPRAGSRWPRASRRRPR